MAALTAILIQSDVVTATVFGPEGQIEDEIRGADLAEIRAAGPGSDGPVVVADERVSHRAVAVGVVNLISAESAARALSLAGHEVVATLAVNTHLFAPDRIQAIVEAAPDLVLLAGGTDDGDERHVAALAEDVAAAWDLLEAERHAPTVVYAGNRGASDAAAAALGDRLVESLANVRPACERENLVPAVSHLAAVAPGADALRSEFEGEVTVLTAGVARATALRAMAREGGDDVFLLHDSPAGHEAVSFLGGCWNRATAPGGDIADVVARHRRVARELCGVPLLREIADAFGGYTPGRDLLDASPPGFFLASGTDLTGGAPDDVLRALVELIRPRGAARVARVDGARLTRLGLAWLAGHAPAEEALAGLMDPLGAVVSVDGPACAIRVRGTTQDGMVPAGTRARVAIRAPVRAMFTPRGGSLGRGRNRPIRLDLEPMPAGLLVDARGTPECPPRRVRILPDR